MNIGTISEWPEPAGVFHVPFAKKRAQTLFRDARLRLFRQTDRMFAVLLVLQWIAAVAAALWISPYTWDGDRASLHPHLVLATVGGGCLTLFPLALIFILPGYSITRQVVSIAQALYSGLLIHLTGGRIETHFHVFVSLAFLSFYRDWKVLVPNTIVVGLDHCIRGAFLPESVFGIATPEPWRWLEHVAWVLFEDTILVLSCVQGKREMRDTAIRTAYMEERDRWLQLMFDSAIDAIVCMDASGRIVDWNPRAEQVFGWSGTEAVGQTFDAFVRDGLAAERVFDELQRLCHPSNGPTVGRRFEIFARRKDGADFPVEIAIAPMHIEGEVSLCAFIQDVSEQRLSEKRLMEAKELAENANRAKSEFLANMSHEIRTPLNSILGYAELLRKGVDDGNIEARDSYLETIEQGGKHLLWLINDILDLSKIEAGQFVIEKERCSPHQLIHEVISILRVRAKAKSLDFGFVWGSQVPETILTDGPRLRQIVTNLCANAIKFTEKGGVHVTAEWSRQRDSSVLTVFVSDTGIGIPREKWESVFDPFVQSDSSVTRKYGGTGLGLSISRRLARLLGGDVTVKSEVDSGSVFRVEIDAGPADEVVLLSEPPADLEPSMRVDPVCSDLNSYSVLVVEDGESNRELIALTLARAGARVDTAENGAVGSKMAMTSSYDVILMDMQMPVMDGYAATRLLRSCGLQTPIIALTAHAMRGDEAKCLDSGCTGYMTKPISADALLEYLGSIVRKSNDILAKHPAMDEENIEIPEKLYCELPTSDPKIRAIVEKFVGRFRERIQEMNLYYNQEKYRELAEKAHWLKGSGAMAGFPVLSTVGRWMEQAALDSNRSKTAECLQLLDDLDRRIVLADTDLVSIT